MEVKKVTLKQIRFAKELPTAKSFNDAARKAGYSEHANGSAILDAIRTKEGFKECLSDIGLDYQAIAKVYLEIIRSGKHSDKLRALELLHKIRGDFAATKVETTEVNSFEDFIIKNIEAAEADREELGREKV